MYTWPAFVGLIIWGLWKGQVMAGSDRIIITSKFCHDEIMRCGNLRCGTGLVSISHKTHCVRSCKILQLRHWFVELSYFFNRTDGSDVGMHVSFCSDRCVVNLLHSNIIDEFSDQKHVLFRIASNDLLFYGIRTCFHECFRHIYLQRQALLRVYLFIAGNILNP